MAWPTFLNPANNPAPRPIVPKEPKASVNLFTLVNKPFNKLTAPFKVSELTIFSTVSVQVLLSLFNEPYFIQQRSLLFASYNYKSGD